MRTTVTAIDLDRRVLTVRDQSGDERTEGFDQVVLATGAEAVAPTSQAPTRPSRRAPSTPRSASGPRCSAAARALS